MYMPLLRKQIYLDAEGDGKIKKIARATGLSEAEHIRRAISLYVEAMKDVDGPGHPLLRLIGICDSPRGPKDAAVNHDTYLYGQKR
jgi:hypothetical protein